MRFASGQIVRTGIKVKAIMMNVGLADTNSLRVSYMQEYSVLIAVYKSGSHSPDRLDEFLNFAIIVGSR